jgi:predicted nucleic acid-binding Zn ribbon protein
VSPRKPAAPRPGWTPAPARPELDPAWWPRRAARSAGQVLRGLDLPGLEEDRLLARIDGLWAELVGPEIAALTRVEELAAGELRVRVTHPVWLTELGGLAEEIRGRLNERLAELGETQGPRRLRFVTGPLSSSVGGAD